MRDDRFGRGADEMSFADRLKENDAAKTEDGDVSENSIGIWGRTRPKFLRLFTTNAGSQWILVDGGLQGGTEVGDTRIELFYQGIIVWKGKQTFGRWLILIEGKGLGSVFNHIAHCTQHTLRVGQMPNPPQDPTVQVRSITIEPMAVYSQDGELMP